MEGEGADEILTHFAIVSQINLMPCLGFRVRSNYSLVTEAVGALATERSFSEFTCGLYLWSFSEFTCGHFPRNGGRGWKSANLESWCLAETNGDQFCG